MNFPDQTITFEGNSIHTGPLSNRVYVTSLSPEILCSLTKPSDNLFRLMEYVERIAIDSRRTKIIVKVPEPFVSTLTAKGFEREATMEEYYKEKTQESLPIMGGNCGHPYHSAVFMVKYLDPERKCIAVTQTGQSVSDILDPLIGKRGTDGSDSSPIIASPISSQQHRVRVCVEADIPEMISLYSRIYSTYPFPIMDPEFMRSCMQSNVTFFCIEVPLGSIAHRLGGTEKEKKDAAWGIVALASAERDVKNSAAEMTDFATDPQFQGRGFAGLLLSAMEDFVGKKDVPPTRLCFTICRATIASVNRLFARGGYKFGGTLWANTNIGGGIESMNIWSKTLSPREVKT